MIGTRYRRNDSAETLEFTRTPSNGGRNTQAGPEAKESIMYRTHPTRESSRLIFQIGTASPELAVQAAHIVAPHVAGIDVNSGCPKPFSTSGGMGAALLSTPDLLCSILRRLVKEVGEKYEIGISVKIRLLSKKEDTEALVEQLCKTGVTGLTMHCRTRHMRKTERAVRDQLRMVGEKCRAAGVACLMNGDVESREEGEQLAREYGVDGAMMAEAAEKNPSVFRRGVDGGLADWREIVRGYLEEAVAVENRWGNTKFSLAQLMPGKEQNARGLGQARNYEHVCRILEMDELVEKARELDEMLGLSKREIRSVQKDKSKGSLVMDGSNMHDRHAQMEKQKTDSVTAQRDAEVKRHVNRGDFLTDLHHDIVASAVKV